MTETGLQPMADTRLHPMADTGLQLLADTDSCFLCYFLISRDADLIITLVAGHIITPGCTGGE